MQMPSLFKYFAFVGASLLALLSFANFLLEPSTGATVVTQNQPAKQGVTVRHDPRASKVERWRNEQAALKSTVTETAPATSAAAKATYQAAPVVAEPAKPAAQAASAPAAPVAAAPVIEPQASAPVLQTADVSAETAADEAARAEQAKAEKVKAAKAKKARIARERARAEQQQQAVVGPNGGQFNGGYNGGQFYGGAQQRNASNQQDQYYYGQRAPRERQSYNAYAPRQSFGPFGW